MVLVVVVSVGDVLRGELAGEAFRIRLLSGSGPSFSIRRHHCSLGFNLRSLLISKKQSENI